MDVVFPEIGSGVRCPGEPEPGRRGGFVSRESRRDARREVVHRPGAVWIRDDENAGVLRMGRDEIRLIADPISVESFLCRHEETVHGVPCRGVETDRFPFPLGETESEGLGAAQSRERRGIPP